MRACLALLLPLSLAACGSPAPSASDSGSAAPAAPPAPAVTYASLTGDAARGERVFNQCKACHSVDAGRNLVGPSLHGIVGRRAASVPGFSYSPALTASGKTWDAATLFGWLESPAMQTPGTRMPFVLTDPQARADVIAWLETQK